MGRSRGARNISRLLKRLPDEVRGEIIVEMNVAGRDIAAQMRGRTPVRTGALVSGISYKVLPTSLKLQVGLLGTPGGRAKLFYGRILDLGRKAQTVQTRRGPMNVGAIPAKHFVTGSYRDLRSKMTTNLKDIWGRAITKAAAGGTSE